jgi:phage terminase small subunit
VRARIEGFVSAAAAEDADISVKQIMLELARIGFADPRRAVEWKTVRLDDPKRRGAKKAAPVLAIHLALREDDDTAAAISEIRPGPYGVTVRFHDKRAALVNLGKRFGMFREPKEGEGNVTVRIVKYSEQDFQKPGDDDGNV